MCQPEPFLLRPVLAKQMSQRSNSGRYIAPGLMPLSQHCRQLLQGVHVERRMYGEHDRRATDERYIREVCDRIEALRGQRGKDMTGQAGEQESVAVRRRTRD